MCVVCVYVCLGLCLLYACDMVRVYAIHDVYV